MWTGQVGAGNLQDLQKTKSYDKHHPTSGPIASCLAGKEGSIDGGFVYVT